MEYRQLGPNCGLRVSPLSLGTITFSGTNGFETFGHVDVAGAKRLFDIALEAGINHIDTANMYSLGAAEEVTGEALASEAKYKDLLVTSKVRMPVEDGPNGGGASRWHILDQVEKSLRRLRRDHIDLYYIHEWDAQTPMEEYLQTMDGLVRQGKIRYYGVSNFSAWQLMKVLNVCERNNFIKPVSQQIYYTPQAREAEYEVIPAAIDQGIGNQVWSPLAAGLLTGKFKRGGSDPSEETRQGAADWANPAVSDRESVYRVVEAAEKVANAHSASISQVILAWLLARPGINQVVVGARNEDQWKDSVKACELTLNDEEIALIDAANPPAYAYPFWHQAVFAWERHGKAEADILRVMKQYHGM
ncbi:aldo/keto reductase [Carnimonas bestiolae]|uniref:aldo/keto reductase n=1 Tax=Carnimonas bestiolae TaxID=3402172 RepID=UPI003EDC1887